MVCVQCCPGEWFSTSFPFTHVDEFFDSHMLSDEGRDWRHHSFLSCPPIWRLQNFILIHYYYHSTVTSRFFYLRIDLSWGSTKQAFKDQLIPTTGTKRQRAPFYSPFMTTHCPFLDNFNFSLLYRICCKMATVDGQPKFLNTGLIRRILKIHVYTILQDFPVGVVPQYQDIYTTVYVLIMSRCNAQSW